MMRNLRSGGSGGVVGVGGAAITTSRWCLLVWFCWTCCFFGSFTCVHARAGRRGFWAFPMPGKIEFHAPESPIKPYESLAELERVYDMAQMKAAKANKDAIHMEPMINHPHHHSHSHSHSHSDPSLPNAATPPRESCIQPPPANKPKFMGL